jgi:hypothetical protein
MQEMIEKWEIKTLEPWLIRMESTAYSYHCVSEEIIYNRYSNSLNLLDELQP